MAVLTGSGAYAQTAEPSVTPAQQQGKILIQNQTSPASTGPGPATAAVPDAGAVPNVTDVERAALEVSDYDLDVRLIPATAGFVARARLTVRNTSASPLRYITLQISSSLRWESATLVEAGSRTKLTLSQHLLDTDADHTGKVSEAVLALSRPLAPKASLALDTFYSGAIVQDSTRLERMGASASAAQQADWDVVGEAATKEAVASAGGQTTTALRGFGDVLWYPVSAPQLFLGQGAQLFETAGKLKRSGMTTKVHLVLAVDYLGDPPAAAYFCGRRKELIAVSDNADAPVVSSRGAARAEFGETIVGFRALNLFVIESPETLLPSTREATSNTPSLAVESTDEAAFPLLLAGARDAASVLQEWLGLQPVTSLAVLDHQGQPFEDGPLLVAPLRSLTQADAGSALTHSFTHAWIDTGAPWMDEGLAQFFVLLAVERGKGREAAEAQLAVLLQPLALGEVTPLAETAALSDVATADGQPLPSAWSEMFYRRKAAAVWWMLRDIAGDDALKLALQAWRSRAPSYDTTGQNAMAFEAVLEKTSGKDLRYFFEDWVLHDRGLPDLTIADVTPRELVSSTGRKTGWLVAVTVRNDGGAVADVSLVVRADSLSAMQRIRVAAFSSTTARVLIEAVPTEVIVNDGTTPEQRASAHSKSVVVHGR